MPAPEAERNTRIANFKFNNKHEVSFMYHSLILYFLP